MSELELICQVCRKPIEAGHLGIDMQAVNAYEAAAAQWRQERGDTFTASDLMSHPAPAQWVAHCEACEPNACGYCIVADEIDTWKDLVRWTAHLMGKTWFPASDWDTMLEQLANGSDSRIREVRS